MILITDDVPHLPDRETKSIDDLASAFQQAKIDLLYVVTPDKKRPPYEPLLTLAPKGEFVSLPKSGQATPPGSVLAAFRNIMPSIGKSIVLIAPRRG
ncbi:MAG: hypothetical protein ACKV2Q_11475 [Planctomycetaceae bacterium]